MKEQVFVTSRIWRLTLAQRVLMLLAASAYLLAMQPWASTNASHVWNVYSGAGAIAVLALLPPRWRLGIILVGLVLALSLSYMVFGFIRSA